MSFTFKKSFKDVCFCKFLSQAMCIIYACKLKMHFNKCLSCCEELLYLINILLNFEV